MYFSTKHPRVKRATIAALAAVGLSGAAHAIDVDPGDYVPAPPGTSALLVYGQHAERDKLYASGSRQPIQPGLNSSIGIARVAHWMQLGGITVAPQILLPFGRLEGKDDTQALGRTTGVGDAILAMPMWFVNQPEERLYWGVSPYLYLPTGSYRSSRALNLGENRWKFNLQTGVVKGFTANWWADVTADIMFHGKNDNAAGATLKQKPMTQLQGYLRYQMSPTSNVYAGLSHTWGGETRLNGVGANDQARQFKASVGGSHFITPTTQLMLSLGRDLKVENGFKENLRVNARLLQLF